MKNKILLLCLFLYGLGIQAQSISGGEYFFDTAPATGAGTAFSVTPGDTVNQTLNIPVTSLSSGFHQLFVRVKNTNNVWSHYQGRTFYVIPSVTLSTQPNLVAGEWFIDTDPGQGNGTAINFSSADTVNQTVNINTGSLSAGFHQLFIRVKNSSGVWSHYAGRTFYIMPTATLAAQPGLVSGEWFIDTDPGQGNGTAISFSGSDTVNQVVNINTSSIAPGFHNLFVRVKNANGIWSHYQGRTFYIIPSAQLTAQPTIVSGEWFLNTDPGFGNGTAISFSPGDTVNSTINISASTLPVGTHYLFLRVKDADGKWSHYAADTLTVTSCALATTVNSTNATCLGTCSGTATVSVTGGALPYVYSWSNGLSGQSIGSLCAGTYIVSILDNNSCSISDTVVITEPSVTPVGNITSQTNASCNGGSDGIVVVSGSGTVSPYTYSTDGTSFQASGTFSSLAAGSYTITVKDANGCTGTVPVTISQPTAVTGSITMQSNPTCNGGNNGSVTVTGANGTPGYTYSINGGAYQYSGTFNTLAAGNHTVTVKDTNGCAVNVPISLTQPVAVTGSIMNQTNVLCYGGNSGSVTVAGSNGIGSYNYSLDGGSFQSSGTFNGLAAGSYNVTIRDTNNCTGVINIVISQPSLISISSSTTQASCSTCNDGTATLNVSGGTSPFIYSWSTGSTLQNPNNLPVGTHQVTVTDNNGCSATDSVTITVPACNLTVNFSNTQATCYGSCDGTSTLSVSGGTAPYMYSWSNGSVASVAAGLCAGSYTVFVTDALGCAKSVSTTISQPTAFTLAVNSNNTACNSANGSASVSVTGGNAPFDYQWSSGDTTNNANDLSAGIYTITVTDNIGCSASGIATISNIGAPSVSVTSITNLTCFGQNSGSINISVSGGVTPYNYEWSNGSTQQDINNLVAGPYEVTVTGADGCASVQSINVTQPSLLIVNTSSVNADCNTSTGSAVANVTGGTSPYTYSWSNGGIGSTISNLDAGAYTVLVTDANGCSQSSVAAITENGAATLTIDSIVNPACGSTTGSVYVAVTGGVAPFTYIWSNSSSSQDLLNVPVGSYSLNVTGSNGCTAVLSAQVALDVPLENPICLVTVDTATNMNLVVWEKLQSTNVASYNIYKESSQAGVYYLIGNVPSTAMSTFSDTLSNPLVRAWRYKIAAVDACGNESPLSPKHKTIHLLMNIGLSNYINLIWSHYEGFPYSSYNIHRYSDTQGWQMIQSVPSTDNTFTDISAPTSNNLFYIVEASSPSSCFPTQRLSQSGYNSTRSNKPPSLVYVGIDENNRDYDLTIYPNPSKGNFNVSWNSTQAEQVEINIFNMEGKLIYKEVVKVNPGLMDKQIDLSNYSVGMYQFEMISTNQVIHKKIIIN